jgi:hypothetical protein
LVKVKIPFLYRFKEPMLSGVKTCTSRTRKMGDPGDTFDAWDVEFQINKVWRTGLAVVRTMWKREGVESPEEFEIVWRQIHERRGYRPEDLVYVHEFSRVDPDHRYPFRPCRNCGKPYIPTMGENQQDCVDCDEMLTPYDEDDGYP